MVIDTAKSSMARWRGGIGRAVVHHQLLAENRIARELAHGGAMRGQAIETLVLGGDGDGDHLAFELAQARGRQHQIVVERGEGSSLALSKA